APLKAPPWSGKAHREVPFWRRPATMVVEAALLLATVAVPAWYLLRPAPAIAFASRDWVVVGDLKNLTGETKFDESLQTAFRIGLEQSRYVNVLSDLKARETVKLMQRDPEQTRIDRAIGAEIAIRDGARALILPTVAEIGGRVRVTAEVVDPQTQTTVYSESADGAGEDSVLPSIDKVNGQLRARLGEAIATVSSESKPLEKAATANLEALRAYSLARRLYNTNKSKEALALLQQATKLDPDFALAHALIASIYVNVDENAAALREIDRAFAARERLSTRDALYIEAWRTSFDAPAPAIAKWKTLAQLYPDFFIARGMFGYLSYLYANRFDDAIGAYLELASPHNPDTGGREATLGILQLGQERYADADRYLKKAAALAYRFPQFEAELAAAQRRFDRVDALLPEIRSSDVPGEDVDAQNVRISFAADRGRWNEVWSLVDAEKAALATGKRRSLRKLETVDVGLRAIAGDAADAARRLQRFVRDETAAFREERHLDRAEAAFHLLFAAYLAAAKGDAALAGSALDAIDADAVDADHPVHNRMLAVAKAELACAVGTPDEAIRGLRAQPLDGNELLLTHVALMDAYAAAGDAAAAREQADWLAQRRGRAYAEPNSDWVLRPFNVVQADLALLRSAELSTQLGDRAAAQASLDAFRKAWPAADEIAFVSARLAKLAATR
ncbi:MAG TPA: putative peptide modification system cyclase, partial [Dokdonella sp.]